MALSRRSAQRMSGSIWPGFVDAMTALLLVLMFVLTIFMVVQFVLRETISGQANELDELSAQVADLADALGLERQNSATLQTEVGRLDATLSQAREVSDAQAALILQLTATTQSQGAELEMRAAQITSFEAQVATLLAERDTAREQGVALSATLEDLENEKARLITQQEALNLALAKARDEIDAGLETARLAAARREALEALVADLQTTVAARDTSLAAALARIDETTAEAATVREQLAAALTRLDADQAAAEETRTQLAALAARLLKEEAARESETSRADALSQQLADVESTLSEKEVTRLAELATIESLRQRLAETEATLSTKEAARLADLATVEALRQRLSDAEGALSQEEAAHLAEVAAAQALRQRLDETATALSDEEAARLAEAAAAEALREKLKNADTELTAMTLSLEAQRKRAEDTLTLLAAAKAAEDSLNSKLAAALLELDVLRDSSGDQDALRNQLAAALAAKIAAERDTQTALSTAQERALLLASANQALSEQKAVSADGLRKVALLNEQVASLRAQLGSLQVILDEADQRDAESQVQIDALGGRLNTALARVASEERKRAKLEEAERIRLEEEAIRLAAEAKELARYRSDFFGKLREVLGDQEGVRIVGDRFVFSSEVLFESAAVDLSDEGKLQIAGVARILAQVADEIPPEIDWIIRVDGHTDNVPLAGTGEFHDNWELSQGRALSVVRYMIDDLSFSPKRLAATGFGEFQPISNENTPEARARNRRIELKLTER